MAKNQSKICATTIPQNSPSKGRQLELFNYTGNRHKPQIVSIPGISAKEKYRYQVEFRGEILGTFLSADEARELARLRRRKALTPNLELLEKQELTGKAAIFVLSAVGGES